MNLTHIFTLLEEAHALTGHRDFVVIGSLSVLGLGEDGPIPADMSMSNDVDCYTKADPERVFDLRAVLGEDSEFHRKFGYFLDPVSPSLPNLPGGWEGRMRKIERSDLRAWFLDPNDAAVSKYSRGEPRDRRWIRAGIRSGLVSLHAVSALVRDTSFLDSDEAGKVKAAIEEDRAWFDAIKSRRPKGGAS